MNRGYYATNPDAAALRLRELRKQKGTLLAEARGVFNRASAQRRSHLMASEANRDDVIGLMLKNIESEISDLESIVHGDRPRFHSLGEQAAAVAMVAITNGRTIDQRLMAAAGLNKGAGSEGGFLVQDDFAADLIDKTYRQSEILDRVTILPTSDPSDTVKAPVFDETSRVDGSRWGGFRVFHQDEGDQAIACIPQLRQLRLELQKYLGFAYVTNQLLADAPLLGRVLELGFVSEFKFCLERDAMHGLGGAQMIGWLTSAAIIEVQAEGGQDAGSIVPENIEKVWEAFPVAGRRDAVWIVSKASEKQLNRCMAIVKNVAGTENVGAVITPTISWLPAGAVAGSPYAYLNGRPVLVLEIAPQAGQRGDLQLVDLSQYVIADKERGESVRSVHMRFLHDESVFRFVYRANGQPIWAAPRLAYGSNEPESPFVILGARA